MTKNKLLSLLVAAAIMICFAPAALAETMNVVPDKVAVTKSGDVRCMTVTYSVPLGTDVNELIRESVDQDGITYLYDSITSERVAGKADKKSVRQEVYIRSDSDDIASVQAEQPETLPYDEDGYSGVLTLETKSTHMELAPASWIGAGPEPVATAVWMSDKGGAETTDSTQIAEKYIYTFVYTGIVTKAAPDFLSVNVKYVGQVQPQNSTAEKPGFELFGFTLPEIRLPTISMPDMGTIDGNQILWLLAGAVVLASILIALLMLRHRKKKKLSEDASEPIEPIAEPPETHRRPKKKEQHDPVQEARAMPVPEFLECFDRGGTDTLNDEEGDR